MLIVDLARMLEEACREKGDTTINESTKRRGERGRAQREVRTYEGKFRNGATWRVEEDRGSTATTRGKKRNSVTWRGTKTHAYNMTYDDGEENERHGSTMDNKKQDCPDDLYDELTKKEKRRS